MTAPLSAALATPPQAGSARRPLNLHQRFVLEVRAGLSHWVRAMILQTLDGMESAQLLHAVAGDRQHTAPALELLKKKMPALAEHIIHELQAALDRGEPVATVVRQMRPTLSLTDESQIDEDIEIGRLVQAIDSGAEIELQQLAALCGGLRGLPHVDARAVPLPPLTCARAIRQAMLAQSTDAGTRGLLLRHMGHAAGLKMKLVYAEQAELLTRWGVKPAPYRLMLAVSSETPTAGAAATPAPADEARPQPPTASAPAASLQRLVAHAKDTLVREQKLGELDEPLDATPLLQLMDDPQPVAGGHLGAAALDRDTAMRLMERLFRHLEQQAGMSDHGRALLAGLQEPGRALAASEPTLWQNLDHPWWKLIDKLIGVGAAPEPEAVESVDPVSQALGEVVTRMGRSPTTDRGAWQAASDGVQAAAERAVIDTQQALAPQLGTLQSQVDRQELETELRIQIMQQLRATPVCPGLRQFLVGPWAQVLTLAAAQHGSESEQMSQLALVVDDLIRATQQPGKRVSSAQRRVLLRQVNQGLQALELPASRVEAELSDLQGILRNPPPVQEESWQQEPVEPLPEPWVLSLNASLPTVPLDLPPQASQSQAADNPAPVWTSTLEAGMHCRLFLLGRWMTVQLAWVSDTRNLFLFKSRHGGRVHSLTRRMLHKLREAGLAASIAEGLLLAQAMDSLVATDFAAI
jgi:hypothetical protein